MRGRQGQNYPQFDDDHEQEAARFLAVDMDARPVIRAIDDLDRLNAWTEVAKDLQVTGPERKLLRERRQALQSRESDVDVEEFEPASEIEPTVDAVPAADGGATVGTAEDAADSVTREIGADQEQVEYADDADFESQKNDLRGFVFSEQYDTVDAVEEAIDDEFQRDTVRPHVVELLEERLEGLEQ